MSVLAWLFSRTPDIETEAPPVAAFPAPHVPATPDDDDLPIEAPVDGVIELDPVFTLIDYIDSKGIPSRRRITMLRVKTGKHGLALHAVCHERKAFRSFRIDRIQCFIEPDGEVIETARFLRETMLIDVAGLEISAQDTATKPDAPRRTATNGNVEEARQLREFLRAPLAILTAAARADDDFHPEELEVIAVYIEKEILARARLSPQFQGVRVEVLDELNRLVLKMRTQRHSLPTYLRTIVAMSEERKRRFLTALQAVVEADGVVQASEVEFLNEISGLMERARE